MPWRWKQQPNVLIGAWWRKEEKCYWLRPYLTEIASVYSGGCRGIGHLNLSLIITFSLLPFSVGVPELSPSLWLLMQYFKV